MSKKKKALGTESRGLGDTIAKVTELLMIDELAQKLAEMAGKEDCGCERRKEKLNELFPYKNKQEDKNNK